VGDILDEGPEQELSVDDLARRARLIEDTLRSFGVPVTVVEVNRGPAVTQFGLRPDFVKKRYRRSDVEVRQEAMVRLRGLTRNERAQIEADARTRLSRAGNDYPTPEQLEAQMLDLLAGSVDRYMERDVKIKVARIQALSNDLALALEAAPIRIEAPVPGRSIVGLEVPNSQTTLVSLRSVMESEAYRALKSPLKLPLGQDVSGQPAVADMVRMPHMLIAGATGSGKSVCVNSLIASLLFSHTPDTLRFLMVDPKMVELTTYNGIPHLIAPVVTEVDRVVPVLAWATREMDRRYKMFSHTGARNIDSYNEKMTARHEPILPFIIIIIDELADLMMAAPDEVERYICRLAQMARATGIHLILATQRPSVDVVTGLIKANFPARIAFAVTSQIDSRVILDTPGAERLLGRGDMLFMEPTSPNLARLQGCFVSDRELHHLVEHWQRAQAAQLPGSGPTAGEELLPGGVPLTASASTSPDAHAPVAIFPRGLSGASSAPTASSHMDEVPVSTMPPPGSMIQPPMFEEMFDAQAGSAGPGRDALYDEAVSIVREANRASVSLLQRRLRVGYTRAARLIEMMEADGIVGPDQGGSRGRDVVPAARDANS
jgi:S-DNA-T family DNA segregation ATPase FtsK/SpoIIIE